MSSYEQGRGSVRIIWYECMQFMTTGDGINHYFLSLYLFGLLYLYRN
jgi:hypothetical protein